MTKEEYEKLLSSDYWKGYSYSLIKERNFTCEDCGRRFLNERNKLQVHHLVYRDIYPWSYKPEELVVLCRECHEKRHGIIPSPEECKEAVVKGYDTKTYFVPNGTRYEASYTSDIDKTSKLMTLSDIHKYYEKLRYNKRRLSRSKKRTIRYLLIFILLAIGIGLSHLYNLKHEVKDTRKVPGADYSLTKGECIKKSSKAKKQSKALVTDDFVEVEENQILSIDAGVEETIITSNESDVSTCEKTDSELQEE